jgi:hypothetical protein
MNNISKDTFSVILQNLQCNDIDHLQLVNKQIHKDSRSLSMIYRKNKIKEIWGLEIFKIIYDGSNLHNKKTYKSFLNKNETKTIEKVLEMFYKDFIFNDSNLTTRKFIEIYSLYFNQCINDQNNKDKLFQHRKKCILKMFKKEDITTENKTIKLLFGVSSYINRYHDLLGRRITFKEFIADLNE